jgi:hypothetical protein
MKAVGNRRKTGNDQPEKNFEFFGKRTKPARPRGLDGSKVKKREVARKRCNV